LRISNLLASVIPKERSDEGPPICFAVSKKNYP